MTFPEPLESTVNDRYTLVSSDCHAGGSLDLYRDYLDPSYLDEFDAWRGKYSNPFRDLSGSTRYRNWDSARRLTELESEGIVGEVVFPNTVPPFFPTGAVLARPPRDKADLEHRWAGLRAHNRWLADFCADGNARGRRAGIAQILINDVDRAVEEVRWAREAGLTGGVLLPGIPPDCDLAPIYDPVYEPLWSVCEELDVTITHHSGNGNPKYGKHPAAFLFFLAETSFFSHRPMWFMIISGVFERHPGLRLVLTEQGASWVVDVLAQLDRFHHEMAGGNIGELPIPAEARLPLSPSEYFDRNVWLGVSFPSPAEVRARHAIGIDKFMWGSDYPHREGTYPHTLESVRFSFSDVPEAEVRAMLGGTIQNVYGFDRGALDAAAARVGPRVSEIATPLDTVPADAPSPAFVRA